MLSVIKSRTSKESRENIQEKNEEIWTLGFDGEVMVSMIERDTNN